MMAAEQASPVASPGGPEERSEIVEEHLWRHGGPTFKNVQPKSYKILEQQLPQSEMGGGFADLHSFECMQISYSLVIYLSNNLYIRTPAWSPISYTQAIQLRWMGYLKPINFSFNLSIYHHIWLLINLLFIYLFIFHSLNIYLTTNSSPYSNSYYFSA